MRAVYIDESARDNDYYFFGALIVDDDAALALERGLNSIGELVAQHVKGFDHRAEFHGVDMFHGEEAWKGVPPAWRVKAAVLTAKAIGRSSAEIVFRGVNLHRLRLKYIDPFPAHLLTLAHLLEEVDGRMQRVHDEAAIVLADDHHTAASGRRNLSRFKIAQVPGYTQSRIENLIDTIYFGPSDSSRLLQCADVATYFLNRLHTVKAKDPRSADAIAKIVKHLTPALRSTYIWHP